MNKLNYYWRLCATALSFASFGIGGLIIRFIVFPLNQLLPGTQLQKVSRARSILQGSYQFFIAQMKFLGILSYSVEGLDNLNKPGELIIANHPTLIDVVFLVSFLKNPNCIVKNELFNNPFMTGPLKGVGFIPNINSKQLIDTAAKALESGDSLIIFPEGTRTPENKAPRFTRGAAYIAMTSKVSPSYVSIHCEPRMLNKEKKWYEIPHCKPHFKFKILAATELSLDQPLTPKNVRALNNQFYNHFFEKQDGKCHLRMS